MDLLRAAIKAMYYHYPIEDAFGMTVGADGKGNYLKHFDTLASSEEGGFSPRELAAYRDELLNDLKSRGYRADDKLRLFAGLPLLFAEQVLEKDGENYPCVDFQHLFKWREVVKCIGEDLFTTAFLAAKEKKNKSFRKDFMWPNVIGHNEEKVNAALSVGLSDIHTHFGGAIDSFQFNWICLMNDVEGVYDKFKHLTFSYNQVMAFEKTYIFKKMAAWCRVAAAIRMCLFKALVKGEQLKPSAEKAAMLELGTNEDTGKITWLKKRINELRTEAKKPRIGDVLDYAITADIVTEKNANSPFCFYAGERQIMYAFYRAYLQPGPKINGTWIDLFYLYELIKTHLRKEFVFANDQWGLDNYNAFIARSPLFIQEVQPLCNLSSVQTSIRKGKDDYVETRVTSGSLGLTTGEYWKGMFADEVFMEKEELQKRLTFIVQFTKSCNAKAVHKGGRYRSMRAEVHNNYIEMTRFVSSKQSPYEITGVDVGGTELNFRPEVFGRLMRSCKALGFRVTYHVGEEFYDLADGLRAIWEIIHYAHIGKGDRLGHCLALGMAVDEYYKRKHNTLYMPKQILLDNVVWLFGFAKEKGVGMEPELEQELNDVANKMYGEIGYGGVVGLDMSDYYESLLLRSDEENRDNGVDVWSRAAVLDSERANKARTNRKAIKLLQAYTNDEEIIANGEETTTMKMSAAYVKFIVGIQHKMIELVNKTRICIECCPSSNLQICKLDRYDCHPAIRCYLKADDLSEKLNIAVCTDDKGTFSTSLANEFSLLALAATKGKGWSKKLEKDFEQLISQGNKYRFKKISSPYEDK